MANTPGNRLREILATGQLLVAPGVFDGISANLVKRMGFTGAYMTGAGVAASGYGVPDVGVVTASEVADRAAMLAETLGDVPLMADADTGYGSAINVARTVRALERAGVAAIQLEDQTFPKKCGALPDKDLVSKEAFAARLGTALDARDDAVLIARTDAAASEGLSAAIDRANSYAEAGADIVFIVASEEPAEIEQVAKGVDAPKLIHLMSDGLTPHSRLQELGYAVAIHPGKPLFEIAETMIDTYVKLGGTRPEIATTNDVFRFFELVGINEWDAISDKWGKA